VSLDRPPDYADIPGRIRLEREILVFVLRSSDDKLWWSLEEIMHETSDPITALDATAALCTVGLLQRRGDYLMLTRAALRFAQLLTWP
jgi:hypothetical protein